jgi:hypothetical protein
MRIFAVLLAAILFGELGCTQAPAVKQPPVSVSGRISEGGRPVGNVMVSFHPLDHGHVGSFPVKPDGTFQGELIAGDYAYYVSKLPAPSSEAVLKKVDPKYFEPDLERRIAVVADEPLVIALD